MANRIKVAGYSQKVQYSGGIEYRNFSDNLVGNQFTSDGGTTLFTAANFNITTNLDPKESKIFNTNAFGSFYDLNSLDLTHDGAVLILENNSKVSLNFDKRDLSNYAYFGSLREFIRVSLESIIMNWPASIYVTSLNEFNTFLTGPTFEGYVFDIVNNVASFRVKSDRFSNKFNVNYTANGDVLNNFSDGNDLRNMAINFASYNVTTTDAEYPVIGFSGSTDINPYVYLQVSGNPFTNSATTTSYHIKPNDVKIEEFFTGLSVFEDNLLNRLTLPNYTSNYYYTIETEEGNIISSEMTVTWPVTDGYNIDFDTEKYLDFVNNLLTIADSNDGVKTNLMARFFVSESITDFDTIDQKMGNTLRIYGREFDEVKKYIDGISNANVVTYDGVDNAPDIMIKNLARVMGWDLITSLSDTNYTTNFLTTGENSYDGLSRGYTPYEAEIELWRRIIMNTPWLWKSKGTRKAIEFLFKFIGSPDGLVTFNEFIYVADKALDMDLFKEILEKISGDDLLDGLNVDSDGFPTTLPNTSDMYFQKAGLWYRETAGPNSNIDILTGNNPHIGPYDGGQEYIDQFGCLIPDFEPVILTEEVITTGSTNMFTNYDNGKFNAIFQNDVILNVQTDINFEQILLNQMSACVNNLQIVPVFSGCSATTSWSVSASLNNTNIYNGTFGSTVGVINGQVTNGNTLKPGYITHIDNIYNILNNNYHPLDKVTNPNSIVFVEDLASCDDDSYYKGRRLTIDLCLDIDYGCLGGDCDASSLIVSSIDSTTRQVYFENVLDSVVPTTLCCTNLGYTASATTGGYHCYDNFVPITNTTNIYAYFDTTSMAFVDAQAAYTALTAWFNTLPSLYPNYEGNLYTIPTGTPSGFVRNGERWLYNAARPWNGDTDADYLVGQWIQIANLPPSGGTDSEVIVLQFVDETNPDYHGSAVNFAGQPTQNYKNDYASFMDAYNSYDFFRCLVYPIVRNLTGESGALVLQVLAAVEGRIIPQNELPTTNVNVTLLTTQNPYVNAPYASGTMIGLKNLGFQGRYDKQSPASAVFTSETFANDLNEFLNG